MYKYLYAFVFYLIVAGSCVLPLGSLAQQLDIIDLENMSSEVRTDPWKAYLRIANFEEQSNFDDNDEKLWFLIKETGLQLIVPESKTLIASYSFDQISHWESSSNGIKIAVALDDGSTSIFLCKTPSGTRINVILNLFCKLLA